MSCRTVAIILVPRDRFSVFPTCIEALYKHTREVPFRIILVAGGVDESTKRYLQELQTQKTNLRVVISDHLLKQAEARTLAMRHVHERFCVVLENDTIVGENWLEPLLECLEDEGAAVVMPLIYWYRGLHAAGGALEEITNDRGVTLRNRILYSDIRRKRIDYPENHCILIDREKLPYPDLFEDVEPFDVDLGLTLRKLGLSAFLEPRSVVTYAAPPRWEAFDVSPFVFRWDPVSWQDRNRLFMKKWGVIYYDSAHKLASYRRQLLRMGLALWFPSRFTVEISNILVSIERSMVSWLAWLSRSLSQR